MNFEQFVLANEPAIRLSFFLGIFAVIGFWELLAPRRRLTVSKTLRWTSNLGFVVLNTVLLRLIFPLAGVGLAAFCANNGWGLLNHFAVPFWVAAPLAVVTMAWQAQGWALRLALVGQIAFVGALALGLHLGGLQGAGQAVSLAMLLYFGFYFWRLATWPVAETPR